MYDKDGQHPLPQWALGPGATVWRTKFFGAQVLIKKKKKKKKKKLQDLFLHFFLNLSLYCHSK